MLTLFAESCSARAFLSPAHVVAGDESSHQLGRTVSELGWPVGPVVVVLDQAIADLGLAAPALQSLESSGFVAALTEPVRAEPTVGDARAATAFAKAVRPVAVIGIGGGSAIDLAKFVALTLAEDRDIAAFFGSPAVRRQVHLIAVPTTTGTGAEVTRIAMLSEAKRKIIVNSPELVPDLVVLDPSLVANLPQAVIASTGLDALCHAMEAILSTNRSVLSLASSLQGLRVVAKWLRRGYQSPNEADAKRALLYGAHFAGLGLNAGVVLGHSIGYTIAGRTSLPHGITCAMALPACLAYARPTSEPMLRIMAQEATGVPDTDRLMDWVIDLNNALGVPPSLVAAGIPESSAREMAKECLEKYPRPNNPRPLELEALYDLYAQLAAGFRASS